MLPATGRKLTLACVPPHSGPQFNTYAVLPSGEKIAFVGRSKLCFVSCTCTTQYTGKFCGSQSSAFEGAGWFDCRCTTLYTASLFCRNASATEPAGFTEMR